MTGKTLQQILQHELQIARLANGTINSIVVPSIEETYKQVRSIILERGLPNTPKRLQLLERAIAEAIRANAGWDAVTSELDDFGLYEAGVALQTVQSFIPERDLALTSEQRIQSYINESLMSLERGKTTQTGTWAQFVVGNTDSRVQSFNNVVRTAYSRGWTLRETSRALQDTTELLRRESESLARTGYSHYANNAREAMNTGLRIDTDWVLIFTFDSRISSVCLHQSATQSRWSSKDPDRRIPPLHWGCRTTGVILPRGAELEGMRPAIAGKSGDKAAESFERRAENKTPKYRGRKDNAFKAEQIKVSTPYDSFLRQQPDWYVSEVLGKKKSELFLSGKADIKDFFDMSGRPLTLERMREIDPRIFGD